MTTIYAEDAIRALAITRRTTMTTHGDHICTFQYPVWQDVQPAVQILLAKVKGEDVDLPCLVHCGWTVAGFAASIGFPHDPLPPMMQRSTHPAELQQMLETLAGWDGQSMMAFNWKLLAQLVAQLLMEWLNK